MKKLVRYILISVVCAAALSLSACNEYKQAQDDMANGLRGYMEEAGDLQSEFNEAASELNETASEVRSDLEDAAGERSEAASEVQSDLGHAGSKIQEHLGSIMPGQ